ncbi:MAG: hypothetical protein K2M16_07860, partial [Muribaculaceae bacterium]|nr:hypothetical protein [Muribaculaceae bacterium]
TVDLSSQAQRDGVNTVYYWCVDEPFYDASSGSLYGTFLEEGKDYTINEGVTTFNKDMANICCVMVNALFPRAFLMTNILTVDSTGVETVNVAATAISLDGRTMTLSGDTGTQYAVYTVDGKSVAAGVLTEGSLDIELPSAGIYAVKAGDTSIKMIVK